MPTSDPPRCPACGPATFRYRFGKKGRRFYRCCVCGIELQWPLPTQQALSDYYEESFDSGMYRDFTAADEMKRMTAAQRLKEIRRTLQPAGRCLDVGCANGVFVETIGQASEDDRPITAEGVEISQSAVTAGRDRGLALHLGMLADVPEDPPYDLITAFDVLEHVIDPAEFLKEIHQRLADGGHVVLTVPDTGGWVRRVMGRRWYFYIPEEHLHYFDRRNLPRLLRAQGFEPVEVGSTHKPMTYDYALTQFAEFNPWIYRVMSLGSRMIPGRLRSRPVPLPIGEIRVIARKISSQDESNARVNRRQQPRSNADVSIANATDANATMVR